MGGATAVHLTTRYFLPAFFRGTGGAAGSGGPACVQGAHHADAGEHCRTASFRNEDQSFHRCLPFRRLVLGLRQLRDVDPGILERDELATDAIEIRMRATPRLDQLRQASD